MERPSKEVIHYGSHKITAVLEETSAFAWAVKPLRQIESGEWKQQPFVLRSMSESSTAADDETVTEGQTDDEWSSFQYHLSGLEDEGEESPLSIPKLTSIAATLRRAATKLRPPSPPPAPRPSPSADPFKDVPAFELPDAHCEDTLDQEGLDQPLRRMWVMGVGVSSPTILTSKATNEATTWSTATSAKVNRRGLRTGQASGEEGALLEPDWEEGIFMMEHIPGPTGGGLEGEEIEAAPSDMWKMLAGDLGAAAFNPATGL